VLALEATNSLACSFSALESCPNQENSPNPSKRMFVQRTWTPLIPSMFLLSRQPYTIKVLLAGRLLKTNPVVAPPIGSKQTVADNFSDNSLNSFANAGTS